MIKVHGGTRSDRGNLCRTCWNAVVSKGATDSLERIFCRAVNRYMTFTVAECNEHHERGKPHITDLYKTAWILETSKANRSIGFVPYRDWRLKHADEDPNQQGPSPPRYP